jgi:hypothetical protein
MEYDWGPFYLVPSEAIPVYSGGVVLRDEFDEELLRKQIDERGFPPNIVRVTNAWFYRKKGSATWTRLEESSDIRGNFPVRWETTLLEDGQYEIIGFMQAFLGFEKRVEVTLGNGEFGKCGYKPVTARKRGNKRLIADQKVVEVTVENHPGLSAAGEAVEVSAARTPDRWAYMMVNLRLSPSRGAPSGLLNTKRDQVDIKQAPTESRG